VRTLGRSQSDSASSRRIRLSSRSESNEWGWIDYLPTPALVFDRAGVVVRANAAIHETLGFAPGSLNGHDVGFLVPDYVVPSSAVLESWQAETAGSAQRGLSLDLLAQSPDGTVTPVSVHLGPAWEGDLDHVLTVIVNQAESTVQDRSGNIRGLLTDLGRIIGSSLDIHSVCGQFSVALMRVLPAERVVIATATEGGAAYETAYASGRGRLPEDSATAAGTLIGEVLSAPAPMHFVGEELERLAAATREFSRDLQRGLAAVDAVPLMAGDDCVGVLALSSSRVDAFNDNDLELLEQVGRQVAGAIMNMRLHADLQRESEERKVLARIGRLVGAALELSDALEDVVKEIGPLMRVDELVIVEVDRDGRHGAVRSRYGPPESGRTVGHSFDLEGTISGRAVTSGEPLIIDVSNIERYRKELPQFILGPEVRSNITVPLFSKSRVVGALSVRSHGEEPYTDRDVSLVTRIGDQIAGAVHTARLYAAQQRETEVRRRLADIAMAVSQDLDLRRVFERMADELAEFAKYDILTVSMRDAETGKLFVPFALGVEPDAVPVEDPRANDEERLPWRTTLVRRSQSKDAPKIMQALGAESLAEVPLGTEATGPLGYLGLMSRRSEAYSGRDLEFLKLVGSQVTPAVQNALAHEQALRLAEAREREARLEARSRELEDVSTAKTQFLSVVSHELRTPLTSISAYADLIARDREQTLSERQRKQVEVIRRSTMRLKYLIGDLLDVSKIETGTITLQRTTFDLREVVREVVESFQPVLQSKRQVIESDVCEESLIVNADRQRVLQIFSNLVENASKYSAEGTPIAVDAHLEGAGVVVTVTDNGSGISEEDRAQLFTPFFRADNDTTRAEPGTGLGLALVKRLTALHGGSVEVESELGRGSAFTVILPFAGTKTAAA
jgi:signal transduction histidine kinase/putative methionine-R-sulfoxide reductase with GAF domain